MSERFSDLERVEMTASTKSEVRTMLQGKKEGDTITIHYTDGGTYTCVYVSLGFSNLNVKSNGLDASKYSISFSNISNIT